MEPLDPQDPLWKLLGKTQQPKVRPQFLANVVREARNTAQDRSTWARLKGWWADFGGAQPVGRVAFAAAALAVVVAASVSVFSPTQVSVDPVANVAPAFDAGTEQKVKEVPLVPEVETQLESLDYLDALLAVEDTSGFTDNEIAYLLY